MVKAKHQKFKNQNHPNVYKQQQEKKENRHGGKKVDATEIRSQLDALGLKVVELTADGNCFFRGLADQLEGDEEKHDKYRTIVVNYIVEHREQFEPFIEDNIPFNEYCKEMKSDGSWAGNMELQAASLVTQSNICIHRVSSPRWYIWNFDDYAARMIHLSYHNESHYNSVRQKEDPCNGPAKQIVIKADADISAQPCKGKVSTTKSKGMSSKTVFNTDSATLVMVGSGCENASKVEQVLGDLYGDVDAAIAFLIAEREENREIDNILEENGYHSFEIAECKDSGASQQLDEFAPKNKFENDGPCNSSVEHIRDDMSSKFTKKDIPRNKNCPCGSKKKHKSCCGSVHGKPSTDFVMKHTVSIGKNKNGRKNGKHDGPSKAVPSDGFKGHPPDMGALCI